MATNFKDWTAEAISITPAPNMTRHPITGERVDATGIEASNVVIVLTHVPSGNQYKKGDRFAPLTRRALVDYCRDIIIKIDMGVNNQGDEVKESPLLGTIDLNSVTDQDEFNAADVQYTIYKNIADKLVLSAQKRTEVDTKLAELKTVRDNLSVKVADLIIAGKL